MKTHTYEVSVRWTGNNGTGTATYRGYDRAHEIASPGKPTIACSSDPAFRGDRTRWNPEDLLIGSASACHQLWYLHLCSDAGVVVTAYEDAAQGILDEESNGSGQFSRILLRPRVTIAAGSDTKLAQSLHHRAHEMCFIARSLKCPVECEPTLEVA